MIQKKKITTSLLGAVTLSGSAFAGEIAVPPAPEPSHSGDWCESLAEFGKFHSDPDGKFIQELKFFGRLHYTYANINGDDVNGDSFSEDFDEFRRFRVGAQIKFLDHFTLMGRANLVSDGARNGEGRDFSFQDWDELKLTFSKKDILGLDKFSASYGRHKVGVGAEARRSSKKIKTVERAAISNKIFTNRYTGLLLSGEKGNWGGTFLRPR